MRFRRFSTLLHTAIWLVAGACTAKDETAARDDTFKVALLTPGPISDQSWNAGAYRGLLRIRDSLDASVSHIHTVTPAEFEENFRHYGEQGYDLVFGHGFEFQDAALRVAPAYPRTIFVTTSGNSVAPNVAGMVFAFEDGSYLAGMIAGAMTKTNTLGVIGGTELPPVKASFLAFEAGARRSNPNVRMLTSYIGNWDDVSAAKEQTLAQLTRGADVIFQNADAASLGIFQAARERPGVYVFGTNSDQNAVAPDVIIGSVVLDVPHAFVSLAREVKAGTFESRVVSLGTGSNVVRLVLNPALADRIPAATRAAVDSVEALLRAGRFQPLPDSQRYSAPPPATRSVRGVPASGTPRP